MEIPTTKISNTKRIERKENKILINVLSEKIEPQLWNENDSIPDFDGEFHILKEDCLSKTGFKLSVQIKSVYYLKSGSPCAQCKVAFLGVCHKSSEAVLLVGVDSSNKKIFWRYLDPDFIISLFPKDKENIPQTKQVKFLENQEITTEDDSYVDEWEKVCLKHSSKFVEIQNKKRSIPEKCFEGQKEKKYNEITNELRIKEIKPSNTEKFKEIKNKFQQIFIDYKIKEKYYYAFIYLLAPFYKDERDKFKREKLRKLFDITKEIEESFINKLHDANLIEITGDLVTIKDEKMAKKNLNAMINALQVNLEKVIDLFLE